METNCIAVFGEFLTTAGYKEHTRIGYLRSSAQYLETLDLLDKEGLYRSIIAVLGSRIDLSRPLMNSLRAALNQFFLMKTGTRLRDYGKELIPNDEYDNFLSGYFEYLIDFMHMAKTTAMQRVNIANRFIRALVKDPSIPDWRHIDAKQVKDYILSRSTTLSSRSMNVEATCLRSLFNFLDYCGCKTNPSIMVVPLSASIVKNSGLPNLLSDEELKSTECFYDKDTERDKRNNAIVMTFIDLGLRTCEVASILLEDIRFAAGELLVRASKTRSQRILPLNARLCNAYKDYILNYRPRSKYPGLFLRIGKDAGISMNTEGVRRVIRFVFAKSGIQGYWKGPHSYRRTVGSKLYNTGVGIKVVADILGHECITSTAIYAKVDIDNLRSIAADWPIPEVPHA